MKRAKAGLRFAQIAVKNRLDEAKEFLSVHPDVDSIADGDDCLVATLKDGVADFSQISNALFKNGFELTMFREEEVNLESAFMALTKGVGAKI